jgi:hypothetical protein
MQILIFTSSFLKQSGALTTTSIIKHSVFMRITFKIFVANPIYSAIRQNSVRIGNQAPSLPVMRKDVNDFKNVSLATDGKSNNFIPLSIKLFHVKNKNVLKDLSAHFTIVQKIVA